MVGGMPKLESYSWILCLDTSVTDRIGLERDMKEKALSFPLANIDHHPDNKLFGRLNFVSPDSAATAEIIFKAAKEAGLRISQSAATCLMIGLVMDTGGFRFDNTKASTFSTASEIMSMGADYPRIINSMFFSQPLGFVALEGELISKELRTSCGGRYAWAYLSDEMLAKHKVEKKDTETLIDSIRKIEGVEIAAVFYRKDDGFKFSLRSKNRNFSVAKIARALNGGGHELAAGGFIRTSDISEAEKILLSHVSEILEGKRQT
jgi:phosphoesterase RecJ-like protein